MQTSSKIQLISKKSVQPLTKKHKEIIDKLELMLEKGIPDHTMSQLAAKLKVSLRTLYEICLLYTSPSPRDMRRSRMPSSA